MNPPGFKAWGIVNDETGRIVLIDVSYDPKEAPMASLAIYMTKKAAKHHCVPKSRGAHYKNGHERVARVFIREIVS